MNNLSRAVDVFAKLAQAPEMGHQNRLPDIQNVLSNFLSIPQCVKDPKNPNATCPPAVINLEVWQNSILYKNYIAPAIVDGRFPEGTSVDMTIEFSPALMAKVNTTNSKFTQLLNGKYKLSAAVTNELKKALVSGILKPIQQGETIEPAPWMYIKGLIIETVTTTVEDK